VTERVRAEMREKYDPDGELTLDEIPYSEYESAGFSEFGRLCRPAPWRGGHSDSKICILLIFRFGNGCGKFTSDLWS